MNKKARLLGKTGHETTLYVFGFLSILIAVTAPVAGPYLLRPDRIIHIFVMSSIVFFFLLFQNSKGQANIWKAIVIALILGICKELIDTKFDLFDMVANLLGLGLGILLSQIHNLIASNKII